MIVYPFGWWIFVCKIKVGNSPVLRNTWWSVAIDFLIVVFRKTIGVTLVVWDTGDVVGASS